MNKISFSSKMMFNPGEIGMNPNVMEHLSNIS